MEVLAINAGGPLDLFLSEVKMFAEGLY